MKSSHILSALVVLCISLSAFAAETATYVERSIDGNNPETQDVLVVNGENLSLTMSRRVGGLGGLMSDLNGVLDNMESIPSETFCRITVLGKIVSIGEQNIAYDVSSIQMAEINDNPNCQKYVEAVSKKIATANTKYDAKVGSLKIVQLIFFPFHKL